MDLRVQRRHKKREGKVERDTARVFYMASWLWDGYLGVIWTP